MLTNTILAFIGSGTFAEATIKGILNKGLTELHRIIAGGPRPERGRELEERYGVKGTTDNKEAAQAGDIVILFIKAQVLPLVLDELHGLIRRHQLIFSIVGGARIDTIARGLHNRAIVRVMPNTPAQIGEGMSVWVATPEVTEQQRAQAKAILQALGKEIYVEDEDALDMATAVSGTGPPTCS